MGRGHRRATGTVVERSSRYLLLVNLIDGFPTERVNARLLERFAELPAEVLRTLTWDQGTKMSAHQQFTRHVGDPGVLLRAAQPMAANDEREHQRAPAPVRPQGQDFADITTAELRRVAHDLNHRPRRTLNWQTPAQRLHHVCALTP
jgi:IS30 family transposase